eukprot:TRINITY_DN5107_c0_g1_i4.p1 TRINITY_DN5107_c0_g1~~TRINITY_DN5107_c0_g1_i4.p1  ORF type:complete len:461 (-),score=97.48 TRINITY_DN5107_c0_g1_i4:383-1765(-)
MFLSRCNPVLQLSRNLGKEVLSTIPVVNSAALSTTSSLRKLDLANKYHGLEKNVWVEFIQLALDYKPLNLGQGLPDDLVPEYVINSLREVINDPSVFMHQYTRGFGHPRLVNAIANLYSKLLNIGHQIDPNKEVLVTDGAYEALFTAILGHVNPGDEVIIIEPYFDCYEPMVRLAGGTPKFISLKPTKTSGIISSGDWKLDPEELRQVFTSKTKAIIFNNPNNPLGKVFSRHEIDEICDLCRQHDVLMISDDVYEHMVFDEHKMIRVAELPGMWDRTITIGSAGKTFSVTGWKLGWAYGPEHLIKNCQVVHQNCVYACPTPIQEAVARAFELEMSRLDSPDCYFKSISVDLARKRDFISGMLENVGMKPVIPEGGYFIMADWSSLAPKIDLSSESDPQRDYRFVKWLSKNRKLQGIPPSAFFSTPHKYIGEDYIRFCFIKHDDSLKKAEEILNNWRKELN